MTRRCQICEAPTVELETRKAIRLGIEEHGFVCRSCGWSFKTFNPVGFVVWVALFALVNIGFAVAFAMGKAKSGDELGLVVALLALDACLAAVGWGAWRNHRRNPPVG